MQTTANPNAEPLPSPGPAPASRQQNRRIFINFHIMLCGMLVILIYMFSQPSLADPDIWWHLNFAKQIVQTHSFPRVDTYSFTAAGSAWMDHEWLAEVAYYGAQQLFGLRGLYGLYLVLAWVIELLIFYRATKYTGDAKNSFLVAVFCVLLIVVSFGPRMLLFGWLYMLLMVLALDRFREGSTRALWIIPPLFLLWVNTHGSWMIGLVVFAIIIGSGLVKLNWGKVESQAWTRAQTKLLILTFAASVALLFVNPYGYRLVWYPFDMAFHQSLNISHVEEWASVDFHTARGKVVTIMLASVFGCALFSDRKWRLDELLLVGLAIYSGLTYVRFLFMIAVLATPIVAARVHFFPPYDAKKDKQWINALLLAICAVIIIWRFPSNQKLQKSVDEKYPAKAVQYLREHNIKDRVLTDYLFGGYVEHFYPQMPVFIDSRVDIFEYNGTLKDYLDFTGVKNTVEILGRYNIQYVFMKKDEPVIYLLKHVPGWTTIYQDDVAVIVKRNDVPDSH